MLATRVQLTITNSRTANIGFVITAVGFVIGMAVLTVRFYNTINYFVFSYLALIVVVGALLRFASRSLTTEKAVLLSKG